MTAKDGEIIGWKWISPFLRQRHGSQAHLERMHFNQLLPALERDRLDMVLSGVTMTPQRNLKVAFVGPYFARVIVLTKKKNVESVDELAKMIIRTSSGCTEGVTSQMFVENLIPKAKLVLADNYDQARGILLS